MCRYGIFPMFGTFFFLGNGKILLDLRQFDTELADSLQSDN